MAKDLQVVGKSIPRIGAYEKVTGKTKFTADLNPPGTLYCKLLRSPYAHALVLDIDTHRAEKLKGVKAILTHQDVPEIMVGEAGPPDTYVLADKARYAGDSVVAVAAETEAIAEKALELINVKYQELPVILDPEEALKPGATLIPPPAASPTNLLMSPVRTTSRDWGDVEKGFRESENVVEDECATAPLQHMTLEPRAYLAKWEDDQLIVWSSTHHLFGARSGLASFFNLPQNRVRVISPFVGGAFGGKGDEVRFTALVALLARQTQRPVKLTLTREEDMLARSRPATQIKVRFGLKKDRTLSAIHARLTILGGGYNGAISAGCVTSSLRALLRCSNTRFEARSIYTNHPPTGQFRGIMNSISGFCVSVVIDETAEALSFLDPLEFIRKNHLQVGDPCDTYTDRPGCVLSSCGIEECIDRGAKVIGWSQKWQGWGKPVEINGKKRIGLGMTVCAHDSAAPAMTSGAILKVNEDGTADFFTPVGDIGNGGVTTQTQVVSEASGIPVAEIRVISADTTLSPVDPHGLVCSSSAHIRSLASQKAGLDARRQILECAALQLNTQPEEMDIQNGQVFVIAQPDKSITLKKIMSQMHSGGALPVVGRGIAATPRFPRRAFNYGAHFALLEVDTETGQVRVLNYVAAHDLGKALNPVVCESQIQGGVLQGIGASLVEGFVLDAAGRVLNLNTTDYKIYTSADSPHITPLIVETLDPLGAYGAKGFAEAPMVGVAGCISNALYSALGIRFKEIPITPEKILAALKTRQG